MKEKENLTEFSRILVSKFYGKHCVGVVQETVWEWALYSRSRDDHQKDHLTDAWLVLHQTSEVVGGE